MRDAKPSGTFTNSFPRQRTFVLFEYSSVAALVLHGLGTAVLITIRCQSGSSGNLSAFLVRVKSRAYEAGSRTALPPISTAEILGPPNGATPLAKRSTAAFTASGRTQLQV